MSYLVRDYFMILACKVQNYYSVSSVMNNLGLHQAFMLKNAMQFYVPTSIFAIVFIEILENENINSF
jgi:hypothetical protein